MAKIKDTEKKTITLSNEVLGEEEFEKSHAERILQWDVEHQTTNWTLHDPKLKFEDGKIITESGS